MRVRTFVYGLLGMLLVGFWIGFYCGKHPSQSEEPASHIIRNVGTNDIFILPKSNGWYEVTGTVQFKM